jgi:hypothetical protein
VACALLPKSSVQRLVFILALSVAFGPAALAASSKCTPRKMPAAGKTAVAKVHGPGVTPSISVSSSATKTPVFHAQPAEPPSALSALGEVFRGRQLASRQLTPTQLESASAMSHLRPRAERVLTGRAGKLGSDTPRNTVPQRVARKVTRVPWPNALDAVRYGLELHEFRKALQ